MIGAWAQAHHNHRHPHHTDDVHRRCFLQHLEKKMKSRVLIITS